MQFSRYIAILLSLPLVLTSVPSCSGKPDALSKVSSSLLQQVEIRRQQIASPNDQRLKQMQDMGMNPGNLKVQQVFIYLKEPLTATQEKQLTEMGVKIYPDSWIPPVGNNPTGFLTAEMPVDMLEALAQIDFIIRLDTSERKSSPNMSGQ
ncbi:MAG: hypothetical protein ABSA18_03150 [Dehalococcoidia bacterium]